MSEPNKNQVIAAIEEIGADMDHRHGLTPESSWEDMEDRIIEFAGKLEEITPRHYLVEEEG